MCVKIRDLPKRVFSSWLPVGNPKERRCGIQTFVACGSSHAFGALPENGSYPQSLIRLLHFNGWFGLVLWRGFPCTLKGRDLFKSPTSEPMCRTSNIRSAPPTNGRTLRSHLHDSCAISLRSECRVKIGPLQNMHGMRR